MTGLRKRLAFTVILVCLPFVALALVEGIASLPFFVRPLVSSLAEEKHTEHDTLLGWINLPNVSRPDIYGPGIGLRTNRQRFRHVGNVAPRAPNGRARIVCSGDSFTLGYGVADDQTWCRLLGVRDSTVETINMGQGGYGIDQAYLWYLRDGLGLRPNVHVFAFITTDFTRMQSNRFLGFPKPQLIRDGDSLRATNVPVPGSGLGPTFIRLDRALRTLRVYQMLAYLTGAREVWPTSDSLTWDLARVALRDLARRDSLAGTRLVVVYLPTAADFNTPAAREYRRWAREAAERKEFEFIDLVEPFRRVSGDSVGRLFLDGSMGGHYTAAGNAWVATHLRQLVPGLVPPRAVVSRTR